MWARTMLGARWSRLPGGLGEHAPGHPGALLETGSTTRDRSSRPQIDKIATMTEQGCFSWELGHFIADIDARPPGLSLTVREASGEAHVLLATPADDRLITILEGPVTISDNGSGSFSYSASTTSVYDSVLVDLDALERQRAGDRHDQLVISATAMPARSGSAKNLSEPGIQFVLLLREELVSEVGRVWPHLILSVKSEPDLPASSGRLRVNLAKGANEACFGLGLQLTHLDLSGNRVPLLVSEHGIGRGRPAISEVVESLMPGASGSPLATEAVSTVLTTTALRSIAVEGTGAAMVDLTDPEVISFEAPGNELTLRLAHETNPRELISSVTAWTGRFRPLPGWVHEGVILAVQGGSARVHEALDRLEEAKVPVSALWLQDWVGRRQSFFGSQLWWDWHLDHDHYPDWRALESRARSLGIRLLTYFNPYLSSTTGHDSLFREASARGYLVARDDGRPYELANTDFTVGLVDLSNEDACEWLSQKMATALQDTLASGWMADFGEGLPMEGVKLANGIDPRAFHNQYPIAWAQVCRRAAELTGHPDDMLIFHRSGHTKSPALLSAAWLGDQLCSWDSHDGIRCALTGMLSGGYCGYSVVHADAGGYLSFPSFTGSGAWFARDRELLWRWLELGSLSPVFRTHEGLNPEANVQWDHDGATLSHLARCSKIYQAWSPERRRLVNEASTTGLPVARHLWMHYPDDPVSIAIRHEYLLGPDLLVAPVLDPGQERVLVYLPPSCSWELAWSGDPVDVGPAGGWLEVDAPLGRPAILARSGSRVATEIESMLRQLG